MKAEPLRRHHEAVVAFRSALVGFLHLMERHRDPTFGDERWTPRQGCEYQAAVQRAEVAQVAGKAARAFEVAGIAIDWKPSGTWQKQPVNPALGWDAALYDPPRFGFDVVLACCDRAIGVLDSMASEAEDAEQSLAGKVAGFVGFPQRVREIAGLDGSPVAGRVVKWFVGLIQGLLVAVVGGVLVALVVAAWGLTN